MIHTDSGLPQPCADARSHSDRLKHHIGEAISRAGGWIGFDRYMSLALYAPGLGYYSAGARKFGAEGDFITAPEVSPLFARCLADQCAEALRALPAGERTVMELGAGTGKMAVEMLRTLARLDCLPDCYLIVEVSADLRQRQHDVLRQQAPDLASRVRWLDGPPEAPFAGVVVGNEIIDALVVKRFKRTEAGWEEIGVSLGPDGFEDAPKPADKVLIERLQGLETALGYDLPEGYQSEINVNLAPWLATVAGCLSQGVLLFIDYGMARHEYYQPQRRCGTLRCHYRHRAHDDPYFWPGLQDITAWVDFTALAEAALAQGLDVSGYTTQAHFLLGSGMERYLAAAADDAVAQYELAQGAKRLLLPGEMGERFKVMALSKGDVPAPSGMHHRDLRDRLYPFAR